MSTKIEIKTAIKNYITKHGQGEYGWYVGIAEIPKERLFSDHNVDENNGAWIYDFATSSIVAREIETELLSELNVKGGDGGGSDKTKAVYAYKITSTTKE